MSSEPQSELAWKLSDYVARGEEPPRQLIGSPEACEGQLMTDEEVKQFVKDGIATIIILRDKSSERTEVVHKTFLTDCAFLLSLGRLNEDEYNELIDLEGYRF